VKFKGGKAATTMISTTTTMTSTTITTIDKLIDVNDEIKICFIGASGVGKSSSCNSIVGRPVFKEASTCTSVTQCFQSKILYIRGNKYRVCDMPGLADSGTDGDLTHTQTIYSGFRSISYFNLLVFVLKQGRITQSDTETLKYFNDVFPQGYADNLVYLVTHWRTDPAVLKVFSKKERKQFNKRKVRKQMKTLLDEHKLPFTEVLFIDNKHARSNQGNTELLELRQAFIDIVKKSKPYNTKKMKYIPPSKAVMVQQNHNRDIADRLVQLYEDEVAQRCNFENVPPENPFQIVQQNWNLVAEQLDIFIRERMSKVGDFSVYPILQERLRDKCAHWNAVVLGDKYRELMRTASDRNEIRLCPWCSKAWQNAGGCDKRCCGDSSQIYGAGTWSQGLQRILGTCGKNSKRRPGCGKTFMWCLSQSVSNEVLDEWSKPVPTETQKKLIEEKEGAIVKLSKDVEKKLLIAGESNVVVLPSTTGTESKVIAKKDSDSDSDSDSGDESDEDAFEENRKCILM